MNAELDKAGQNGQAQAYIWLLKFEGPGLSLRYEVLSLRMSIDVEDAILPKCLRQFSITSFHIV